MRRRAAEGSRGAVGLDLSFRSPAACFVPPLWNGNINVIGAAAWPTERADGSQLEIITQIDSIVMSVLGFCQRTVGRKGTVYVEEYAFAKAKQAQAAVLREVGGCVKLELWRQLGIVVVSVTSSAVRKTLLQKVPHKDSKLFTELNVRRLGGPAATWIGDEIDAFVVANHAFGQIGGTPLSFPGEWC